MLTFSEVDTVLTLASSGFNNNEVMPSKYTCEGEDISPPLIWDDVPEATKSLVLIMDDPDAPDPDAPKMTWVHWVLYNIPVSATGLAENVSSLALPPGTEQGQNDWRKTGYKGPCPPIGRHRYFHKLYALDTLLPSMYKPTKAQVEVAMNGHILSVAELVG
ncbi:MAG: YbhB/YbcL family Raf kinase inhibitor-like protein, partial [Gammaproteobacteria bacterium]|nr:YbhB/YbcL family Raf kinase inhibitor-like protein [Gammaproteobacteria bacterium]